jgi:uncharacterized protein (TIGR02145 family)
MKLKTIYRDGLIGLILICFLCQTGIQARPSVKLEKQTVGQLESTNGQLVEKEGRSDEARIKTRRFPLLIILGAAVAAGVLVYLLIVKKDNPDVENQPMVIKPAGTVTDFDGNVYQTVQIGDQVWMAENLRSTHYSDGSPIDSLVYNDDEANAATYGRLYGPNAFMRGAASSSANPSGIQGAAPQGWHIPSPAEWQQLITALGGVSLAGGKMKESGTVHWQSPNTGATNESLLAALPSGMHRADLVFQWLGTYCIFASSQRNSNDQTVIILAHDRTDVRIEGFHPADTVSVRCIKN